MSGTFVSVYFVLRVEKHNLHFLIISQELNDINEGQIFFMTWMRVESDFISRC